WHDSNSAELAIGLPPAHDQLMRAGAKTEHFRSKFVVVKGAAAPPGHRLRGRGRGNWHVPDHGRIRWLSVNVNIEGIGAVIGSVDLHGNQVIARDGDAEAVSGPPAIGHARIAGLINHVVNGRKWRADCP